MSNCLSYKAKSNFINFESVFRTKGAWDLNANYTAISIRYIMAQILLMIMSSSVFVQGKKSDHEKKARIFAHGIAAVARDLPGLAPGKIFSCVLAGDRRPEVERRGVGSPGGTRLGEASTLLWKPDRYLG
jgi:hypothetical protein